jgi:predicted metal-dependent peptidase
MRLERFIGAAQQLRARGLQPPPLVERVLAEHRSANVPWRHLLAEFLSSVLGDRRRWIPPNRRHLHRGMYLPSRRVETPRLLVAIDTSLSTREHQDDFWSEILSLLRGYDDCELLVIECDDRVRTVRTFTSNAPPDPSELAVSGLGATDFRPVFEWVAARPALPRAVLVLTDGRGPAPAAAPPYPMLWVLTADGQRPASWGRAVRLSAHDTSRSGPP